MVVSVPVHRPMVVLILDVNGGGVMAAFANSEPGPDNFHFPTIALAFSVKSFATSSKVSGMEVLVVTLVPGLMVSNMVEVIQFMVNSLKICCSIISGKPYKRSKIPSLFE